MYDNIGSKIKIVAKVLCWLGIILTIIMAIILFVNGNYVPGAYISGVIYLIFGPLFSWIGSLFIYGFGELIERAKNIENKINVASQDKALNGSFNADSNESTLFGWKCVCGRMNPIMADTCICGRNKYGNQENGVQQKTEEAKKPVLETDSEMVVCPSCGKAQKKNPFGCIFCHSPLEK